MPDPRVEKLAKTLVEYSVKVKPGDWVVISTNRVAEPLAAEVLRHILRAGGYPSILMSSDAFAEIIFSEANDEQLEHISPFERMPLADADVYINIGAVENTRNLGLIDPARVQLRSAARKDLMGTYMQRSASGELRWTLTQFPCPAFAQEADMSLREFEDFVYHATFADQDDPVKHWNELEARQERLVQWLKGKNKVELHSPTIDLSMSVDGRRFINSSGTHNMPSGEIFTGPVEDSADGWVEFTYPAIMTSREVDGVRLEFKAGRVVKASAKKNEEFLLKMVDQDAGARFLGELGIGTNYAIDRFTKSILYDEKIGGTIHLALGASYPETGGKNESALHWDMICDMRRDSEIRVDGELFYKDGQFQV
ncbi:MAG: aminopeptidase [Anaerolineales bacterium]